MNTYTESGPLNKKRTRVNYRRIYKNYHGHIPVDSSGRTFDIHHVDGDTHNNHIDNLVALSIIEHYNLHLLQKDYVEAWAIGARMKISTTEIGQLASLNNQKTMKDGTNPFCNPLIRQQGTQAARLVHQESIKNGTFHLQSGEIQRVAQQDLVKQGKHHLLGPSNNNKRLAAGTHPTQIIVTCPNCCKTGSKPGMMSKHFNNCTFYL